MDNCFCAIKLLRTWPEDMRNISAPLIRFCVRGATKHYNTLHPGTTYTSTKAAELPKGSSTIREHPVPVSELNKRLAKIDTAEEMMALLPLYSNIVIVTEEEDRRLREAKLTSCMPKDWDGIDIFARYKVVGIEISR